MMKVYNTLSGSKEEFVPISGNEVRMYVCGVTPYAEAHIGHAMSYINFDVIRRYLKFKGFKVKYIQNITDIDDKIIDRANRLEVAPSELARKYSASFTGDMEKLNVVPADFYPTATGEVEKIIEVVKGLVDKGYAYPAGGSVYFRVRKDAGYGKLSHRSLKQMLAGARVEVGEEKEFPMDFVLWKASREGEPFWDSPWGPGRPGWHIECSAMSLKYLGEQIDVHGGGQDLIFPHHENEVAQSEGFTGKKPFVRYWLHNGLLRLDEEKMSKSLGNLVTIKDALKRYSADAIRIFVLGSHYRSPLTYSEEALAAAEKGAERLLRAVSRDDLASGGEKLDAAHYQARFTDAMGDDFNTPEAMAALFDLARAINQSADSGGYVADAQAMLRHLAEDVMGLKLETDDVFQPGEKEQALVKSLIDDRTALRKVKKFALADKIRGNLDEMGINLEDSKDGTKAIWKKREALKSEETATLENLHAEAAAALG